MNRTHGFRAATRLFALLSIAIAISTSTALADNLIARIVDAYTKQVPDIPAALGISRMECTCSYSMKTDPDERFWSFESEPRIRAVNPSGPARGKLETGDAIVAIDGMLITTREAGRRFANIAPGESVELTVRRRGTLIDVSIVPEETSNEEATVEGLGEPLSKDLLQLRKALEELSELSVEPESLSDTLGSIGLADLDFRPLGWFGFGLSFSGSMHRSSEDGKTLWSFDAPPLVESVRPDSPAERAGLQRKDMLTHIDGVRLDTRRGGRMFSEVLPGQTVEFEFRRRGVTRTVRLIAEQRPEAVPVK